MRRSLYEVLRVEEGAGQAEIKRAYRRLARRLHPDVNTARDAAARMGEVNEAYRVLGNAESRAKYDAARSMGIEGAPAPPTTAMRVYVRHRLTVVDLPSPVYSLAFSPGGKEVAAGCFDNAVRFFSGKTGKALGEARLEGAAVSSLKWITSLTLLAAGSGERSANVWRIVRRAVAGKISKRADWASQVLAGPGGRHVFLGSVHRTVVCMDAASGETLWQRRRHDDSVSALAVSADGEILASGGNDHKVVLWDVERGIEAAILGPLRAAISQLAFSDDGSLLAVSLVDHGVRIFELATGAPRTTLWGHDKPVEALAFHPSGQVLGSASRDGSVILWNPVMGERLERLTGIGGPVKAVAFSADGLSLAAGGLDRTITLWGLGL